MNALEPLESRRLLAVTAQLVGNVLFVRGDDAADGVTLTETAETLVVAGGDAPASFARAAVAGVSLDLGGGDDSADLSALTSPLYAEADLGDGDDLYRGSPGPDRVVGGAGDDSIDGNAGDDTLRGEAGDDVLSGGSGRDRLWGHAGLDALDGGGDNDHLDGGADADTLLGGGGLDVLVAGSGDDALYGGFGDDWAEGDAGDDQLFAADVGRDDDAGRFFALGGDGDDSLVGSNGDDSLDGGLGGDTLRAGGGDDDLYGGDGADYLDGGTGGDGLVGSPGDTLVGGDGPDRFLDPVDLAARLGQPVQIADYRQSKDALLRFTDANADGSQTPEGATSAEAADYGRWTADQVKRADETLSLMQHATGNLSLFKGRSDGAEFEFLKTPPESEDSTIVGSYQGGLIRVYGGDLGDFLPAVIAHEIGHDLDGIITRRGWNNLSGWVQSDARPGTAYARGGSDTASDDATGFDTPWWYKDQSWFPTDYARTDPFEDFSESFEYYWRTLAFDGDRWEGNPRLADENALNLSVRAEKLAFIQNLVNDLSST